MVYVKELARLTGVSVRTLHHYDEIGLLKPSLRLQNGYRVYSESDLVKLQQIIALKFFGLSLSAIEKIMKERLDAFEQLQAQLQMVQTQVAQLQDVQKTLEAVISQSKKSRLIEWHNTIRLIKVYRMTQDLKKTWAGKVLTEEQFTQLAKLRQITALSQFYYNLFDHQVTL